jgi:flavin-dependent dehydrogenase
MRTIKILGAGPAGLTAAVTLARAGLRVSVFERAASVGSRRGDLEGVENWTTDEDVLAEWRGWGLEQNFSLTPFRAGTWFGPGFEQQVRLEDEQPLLFVVSRGSMPGDLDAGLLAQALAAGVQVQFNRPGDPSEVDIVASGAHRPTAFGAGYKFRTSAPDGVFVCYDDDLTPRAYSYVAIAQGRGSVVACAMMPTRRVPDLLPRVVEGFQSRLGFDMLEPEYFAGTVSLGLPRSAQVSGRLYVGEAAGLQDLFAGFGIRVAMATGYLAARSLLEGRDYDRMWQERFGPLQKAAGVNRWLQECLGNPAYTWMLRYMRLRGGAGRAVVREFYRPAWFTHLLWPFASRRWRSWDEQAARGERASRLQAA